MIIDSQISGKVSIVNLHAEKLESINTKIQERMERLKRQIIC